MVPARARSFVSWVLAFALSLGALSAGFAALAAPGDRFAIAQAICTSTGLAGHASSDPAAPSPAAGHSDACPLCTACGGCAPGPQRANSMSLAMSSAGAAAIGAHPARTAAERLAARPRAPPPAQA